MFQETSSSQRLYRVPDTESRLFKVIGCLLSFPIALAVPSLCMWLFMILATEIGLELTGDPLEKGVARPIVVLLLPLMAAIGPWINRSVQNTLFNAWYGLIKIRLGNAKLSVSPAKLHPGDSFALNYHQPIHRSTTITGLTLTLIQRKRIVSYRKLVYLEEKLEKRHDRIIQQLTEQVERSYEAGEVFERTLRLTIPAAEAPTSQTLDIYQEWVLRAHLHIHHWPDLQEEYFIEVPPPPK